MTPEEKAKHLINTFNSKEVALLCVLEIIKSWGEDGNNRLDFAIMKYWENVTSEIKKTKDIVLELKGVDLLSVYSKKSKTDYK